MRMKVVVEADVVLVAINENDVFVVVVFEDDEILRYF